MSYFVTAAEEVALEKCKESHEWHTFIYDVLTRLNEGYYDSNLVDAIMQPWGTYTIGDAFSFIRVWARIQTGDVLYALVEVGEAPHKDKSRDENQAILRKLEHVQFRGENPGFSIRAEVDITQQNAPCDGIVYWENLRVGAVTALGTWDKLLPRGSVPLEIGSTRGGKTLEHLLGIGVARWPYNSKLMTLLITNPDRRGVFMNNVDEPTDIPDVLL